MYKIQEQMAQKDIVICAYVKNDNTRQGYFVYIYMMVWGHAIRNTTFFTHILSSDDPQCQVSLQLRSPNFKFSPQKAQNQPKYRTVLAPLSYWWANPWAPKLDTVISLYFRVQLFSRICPRETFREFLFSRVRKRCRIMHHGSIDHDKRWQFIFGKTNLKQLILL